jgi:hypothetical protein
VHAANIGTRNALRKAIFSALAQSSAFWRARLLFFSLFVFLKNFILLFCKKMDKINPFGGKMGLLPKFYFKKDLTGGGCRLIFALLFGHR